MNGDASPSDAALVICSFDARTASPLDEQHGGIVVQLVIGMLEHPVA